MQAVKQILVKALGFANLRPLPAAMNGGADQGEERRHSRRRRRGLIVTAATAFSVVLATPALADTGTLNQKPGTDGCVSETGTGGACIDGKALEGSFSLVLSPDGRNAYVASVWSDAVSIFDRDPATGKLTQKSGPDGCISETGSGGGCTDGKALDAAQSLAVSPDGKNVYVVSYSSSAVAIFDRDPTTGKLTQKAGTDGCISETGSGGGCTDGKALDSPQSVIVSPDGKNTYVTSYLGDAVAILDRDPATGKLTQNAGIDGCVSETGSGGACIDGKALDGAYAITVSPDGNNAYVASSELFSPLDGSDAVAIFNRDPATGKLTQKAGTDGCISDTGTGGACVDGRALAGAQSVTLSPDGASVYIAASASSAVAIFDRDPTTGKLTQKPGTDGCVSDDGSSGSPDFVPDTCVDGAALGQAQTVTVSPGGESTYVASRGSGAVAIFDRDPTTGKLTQKPGTDGCVSDDGAGGSCADGVALDDAAGLAISSDGKNAYIASFASNAVAIFDRNDGIRPTTTIDSGPSGTTNDQSPSFTFSASEPGSTFECKLDSEPFATCTSPKFYSNLPEGPHAFSVRATDIEANTGEPASRSFTVALPVPKTKIESKPKYDQSKKTILRFSSSIKDSTFMCKLDKSKFKGCKSPKKYKNLKAGKHSFYVYAISPQGIADKSLAKIKFKVKGKK